MELREIKDIIKTSFLKKLKDHGMDQKIGEKETIINGETVEIVLSEEYNRSFDPSTLEFGEIVFLITEEDLITNRKIHIKYSSQVFTFEDDEKLLDSIYLLTVYIENNIDILVISNINKTISKYLDQKALPMYDVKTLEELENEIKPYLRDKNIDEILKK